MAIKYVIVKRMNPVDVENRDLDRFYAMAKSVDMVEFEALCEQISYSTAVTKADVKHVVQSCIDQLVFNLEKGSSVRLGDLGIFKTTLSSTGTGSAKTFTNDMVKKCKIRFYPGKSLRKVASLATYQVLPERMWPVPKF